MGRVELTPIKNAPLFRKIAMGTWKDAYDPSVYGRLDIDMTNALKFKEKYEKENECKLTPVHLVGKAVAMTLKERPEVNGLIRGSKIYFRKNVDLFFQVNIPGDKNDPTSKATLAGAAIRNCDRLSLLEIITALKVKAERVRTHKERSLKKSFDVVKFLPWWMMGPFLTFTSFLIYGLNWNLTWLGLPKDPFGSAMITNVGSFGIEMAWAPLVPYSRVPLLLAIGTIKDKPVVKNGEVVPAPVMSIGVTFDHRFMDGVHAGKMSHRFVEILENPEKFLS